MSTDKKIPDEPQTDPEPTAVDPLRHTVSLRYPVDFEGRSIDKIEWT
jgi:hypothetical protein